MTARSKMPGFPDLDRPQMQYLDTLGRRQETVGQITDPETTATTAELAAKIIEILEAHRTK